MPDISDDQLRRLQFRRLHEDFMRADGFTGWCWPDPHVPYVEEDVFERWLLDRWLSHIRSPEYRQSADYHFLRAEFNQRS